MTNKKHGSARDDAGINKLRLTTPLYCEVCGSLLPRPYTTLKDGTLRIMRGFTSAYKRMSFDLPAPAITSNFSYPCSDHKVHPIENRVLSFAEAIRLMTIDRYNYTWGPIRINDRILEHANDSLMRDVLGEAVPPYLTEQIIDHLKKVAENSANDLSPQLNFLDLTA